MAELPTCLQGYVAPGRCSVAIARPLPMRFEQAEFVVEYRVHWFVRWPDEGPEYDGDGGLPLERAA